MRRGVYLRYGRSYLSGRARTGTREADVIVCPPPGPDFFTLAGKVEFGYSLGKFMENKPEWHGTPPNSEQEKLALAELTKF